MRTACFILFSVLCLACQSRRGTGSYDGGVGTDGNAQDGSIGSDAMATDAGARDGNMAGSDGGMAYAEPVCADPLASLSSLQSAYTPAIYRETATDI